jgi:hypothetical protein
MVEIALITFLGQVAIPLGLVAWQWRSRNRREWLLRALAAAAYTAFIAVAGLWLLLPWYLPYGYALAGLAAAAVSFRGMRHRGFSAAGRRGARMRLVVSAAMALFCGGALGWALTGHLPPPGPPARISSPLGSGTYYVANGGYGILINPHMKTFRKEALAAYRGQGYAVDIVKLDGLGLRARGLFPSELERYHIYGQPVLAPCDGVVAGIENTLPDLRPPDMDRLNPEGNYVLLACADSEVLLAHLMQSSLSVRPGDRVSAGQALGRVGNSGYSTEPHLHLHAQRPHTPAGMTASEPLPLEVEGRLLFRNSRLVVR